MSKPFYNTIIISMFANTEQYFIEKSACEQTWGQTFNNSVLHLFYTSGYNKNSVKIGNVIYLPCKDKLEDTFIKTLMAIRYVVDNYQFRNLIKTNVSTYINVNVMQKMLEWKNHNDNDSIYCNRLHLVKFGFFARGDFTVLNYNHCKILIEYMSQACILYNNGVGADDVIMSYIFYLKYKKNAIKLFKTIKSADGISKYDFDKINSVVAIRIKQNANHSYKDIVKNMLFFDKMIKNENKEFTFNPIFNTQLICNRIHIKDIDKLTYNKAIQLYMNDKDFPQNIIYNKNEYQQKLFSLINANCCYIDHIFVNDPKQDIGKAKKMWNNIGFSYKQNCYTKRPECYLKFKLNEHHWTTSWCWNNIIPVLYNRIFKQKFPVDMFKLINFIYQSNNLSYHEYIIDEMFYFYDFIRKNELVGNQSILRDLNENVNDLAGTKYHRLFSGFHSVSLIKNNSINSNNKLLFNCDSMAIPLIPIFAHFFKEILVVDNRTNEQYSNIIKNFNATHYVCLMLTTSYYKLNKHVKNLI